MPINPINLQRYWSKHSFSLIFFSQRNKYYGSI